MNIPRSLVADVRDTTKLLVYLAQDYRSRHYTQVLDVHLYAIYYPQDIKAVAMGSRPVQIHKIIS